MANFIQKAWWKLTRNYPQKYTQQFEQPTQKLIQDYLFPKEDVINPVKPGIVNPRAQLAKAMNKTMVKQQVTPKSDQIEDFKAISVLVKQLDEGKISHDEYRYKINIYNTVLLNKRVKDKGYETVRREAIAHNKNINLLIKEYLRLNGPVGSGEQFFKEIEKPHYKYLIKAMADSATNERDKILLSKDKQEAVEKITEIVEPFEEVKTEEEAERLFNSFKYTGQHYGRRNTPFEEFEKAREIFNSNQLNIPEAPTLPMGPTITPPFTPTPPEPVENDITKEIDFYLGRLDSENIDDPELEEKLLKLREEGEKLETREDMERFAASKQYRLMVNEFESYFDYYDDYAQEVVKFYQSAGHSGDPLKEQKINESKEKIINGLTKRKNERSI